MEEPFSDSEYRPFSEKDEMAAETLETSDTPARYKVRTTDPEKQARSQARAEARRTRRTMRQAGQQQQHYKISTTGDSSEESSVDENFDVDSLAESEVENLT